MLKMLLLESRLDRLYKEMKEHIRCYKIAKAAGNEWQREDCLKKIKLLAPEIKREKAKSPEQLDQDAFLRHHYTGFIGSSAYSQYEKEGGLSWLGKKSKYPVLLHHGKYGQFDVEFRQTGDVNRYTKTDANGDIVRNANGIAMEMTPEEIKAEGLAEHDETIVAFVGDKPIGFASNEFGAVGVWVEGAFQKVGIGTDLMDMHIQLRPRVAAGKSKIGQATNAGISLMKAYHRKMSKKHGTGWFKQLRVSKDD
jgi:hypothetical protein